MTKENVGAVGADGSKTGAGSAKGKAGPAVQYVTKAEFDGAISTILDAIQKKPATPAEAAEVKAVKAAGPDHQPTTDPEWDATAKEIVGEYLDHTEVAHGKGGVKFTIVIKKEKSNAGAEYLERMGSDRRTKDVTGSGIEGVVEWCKLVRSNLKHTERN